MRLALRIEVATDEGARKGVPALLRLLDQYQVKASFLLSLGPDFSRYPLSNRMPGWLLHRLPTTYIGNRNRATLRSIAGDGHEVGISAYSAAAWNERVAFRPGEWTRYQVQASVDAFQVIFGEFPRFHGARGWQINAHLLQEEEVQGFGFASDVRGLHPFLPELQGVRSTCPQIPVTLPTLDELHRQDGVNAENLHQYLYAACQRVLPMGEVFSLSAEREGLELLPVFERLLVMWKGSQWEIRSLDDLYRELKTRKLSCHRLGWTAVEGRQEHVAMQSTQLDD
ncbi:MAG: hypothetical protein OQL28_14530 [Sedimenticola sp.]|nr:hypothetical protein [Sedimenticola sp.]